MSSRNDRIVYSTDKGRVAEKTPQPLPPRGDGVVRVRRETQGRGGKTVTTVRGIDATEGALKALAGELKRLCGTGGSIKDWVIEIQGDHRDRIAVALRERGYVVKLAGG